MSMFLNLCNTLLFTHMSSYRIVLYFTAQYIIPYCIVLHNTVYYCIVLYFTLQYITVLYCIVILCIQCNHTSPNYYNHRCKPPTRCSYRVNQTLMKLCIYLIYMYIIYSICLIIIFIVYYYV